MLRTCCCAVVLRRLMRALVHATRGINATPAANIYRWARARVDARNHVCVCVCARDCGKHARTYPADTSHYPCTATLYRTLTHSLTLPGVVCVCVSGPRRIPCAGAKRICVPLQAINPARRPRHKFAHFCLCAHAHTEPNVAHKHTHSHRQRQQQQQQQPHT